MTETTETPKPKRPYRANSAVMAAKHLKDVVLIPGLIPREGITAYQKGDDGKLSPWGWWENWRDAFHFLSGWTHKPPTREG